MQSDEVLVKRYKETRRTHPLARGGRVDRGIAQEAGEACVSEDVMQTISSIPASCSQGSLIMELEKIFVQNAESLKAWL